MNNYFCFRSPVIRGFTLIELMITVAIIGILTSIALPSYNEYVQRTHRAHAKSSLLKVAQWMERAATANGHYPSADIQVFKDDKNNNGVADFLEVEGGRYTLSVASTDTTFVLTATRAIGTGQANDKCGDFTLDQANNRSISGNASGTTTTDCWNK